MRKNFASEHKRTYNDHLNISKICENNKPVQFAGCNNISKSLDHIKRFGKCSNVSYCQMINTSDCPHHQEPNLNHNNLAMAVEFDHMYFCCGDSRPSVEHDRQLEIHHLKEMLLIHLDLIQQQGEQLIAKDKQIKILTEENESLKLRLERIDRRVSLSQQKKLTFEPLTLKEEPIVDEDVDFEHTNNLLLAEASPDNKKESPISKDKEVSNSSPQLRTRQSSPRKILPKVVSPRVSPREKWQRNDSNSTPVENKQKSPEPPIFLAEGKRNRKRVSETLCSEVPNKKIRVIEKIVLDDDNITDHNLRSRDKQKETVAENIVIQPLKITPVHDEEVTMATPKEPRKLRHRQVNKGGDNLMKTEGSYFLPFKPALKSHLNFSDSDEPDSIVEIPRWRTKTLTSLYVMEGTENLEDEIFLKRHVKPESDEKRRKRWDLQRMREQRQYEKLKERYEGKNNIDDDNLATKCSLWHSQESVQQISVEEYLPVCAFGQPLINIPASEFALPWLNGKVTLSSGNTKRKKR